MDFSRYQRYLARMQKRHSAFHGDAANFRKLVRVCVDTFRPVTEPLVLISQIQRSGGSLLSQLFDGHPQLHAHPHELKIGHPKKNNWPPIELSDRPERWLDILFEETSIRLFHEGYKKERLSTTTLATAVQLRFDIHASALPEDIKIRLIHLAGKRVTSEGILVIEAKRFRTQEQNRFDAVERLTELLKKASIRPKARRKTKPTAASQEKRLQSKKQRGRIKLVRSGKQFEQD